MKAFVTGVTGFAGSHLAEHLLSRGDEVWGTSRSATWGPDVPPVTREQVRLLQWDLAEDVPDTLRRELQDYAPDAIYHLGAVSIPAECGTEHPNQTAIDTNVHGTRSLLELAERLPGHVRLVFVSSCYVYAAVDPKHPRVDETAALGPTRAYGKTKLQAEQFVLDAVRRGAVDAMIARAFQHTGPRQSPRMIVPDWARQFALKKHPIRVVCLDTFLDLSDVRDVVRAYRALLVDGKPGEVYNIGSGSSRRSGDIFDALRQQVDPECGVVELAPGRRQHPIADITRIRERTGWRPQVDLETTLSETLQYWQRKVESA